MAAAGVIETARLVLRPFCEDDVAAAHLVWGDADVMRHSISGPTASLEETGAHMARHQAHDRRHGFAFRAIVERETGTPIGVGGLLTMPDGWNAVEVGYRLRRDRWRRGFATEAARAWLAVGFRDLALEEIAGVVEAANAASVRVLEKVGLDYRGKARYHDIPVMHYSARRDVWLRDHG